MSLMRRVRDLTVATLNDRLENAQDPIRVIDGFLREMMEAIRETEALHRQCAAHTASVRAQFLQSDALARKREEQALLALRAGEDSVARAALAEKVIEEEKRDGYRTLYEQSRSTVDELENRLAELRRDYQEVYHKRQYYLARLETLRLQRRMHEKSHHYASQGGNWFHRLEEHITDLELEARSLMDVRGGYSAPAGDRISFGEDKVEQALAMLKRKLEGGH
ncbi:PspA/IM30 family protein [Paenibacillus sp.]|uniref:PspA/IM30 family protein n=1 Tax=Paenibacillus sp. TaxID=58172 RepID=UPI002D28406F|nr:PspA/IM30 family protein [Paenibacillus sp.]HZG84530.1 PspA/IM30 family protein [Paenibacillus sp.]